MYNTQNASVNRVRLRIKVIVRVSIRFWISVRVRIKSVQLCFYWLFTLSHFIPSLAE